MALLQEGGNVEGFEILAEGLRYVGVGMAAGAAIIGPGARMGYLIGQTIASIHRQPEAYEQTRTLMFLGSGWSRRSPSTASFSPCSSLSCSDRGIGEGAAHAVPSSVARLVSVSP